MGKYYYLETLYLTSTVYGRAVMPPRIYYTHCRIYLSVFRISVVFSLSNASKNKESKLLRCDPH